MPDDELIERLQRFERGEVPSPFGELSIVLPRPPVSQQSKRVRKEAFATDLRAALSKYEFLLTGDVQLELEWLVHERVRYESDAGADVDNILKPTLDALAGPTGIIIDDCQVQSVASSWVDWTQDSQQITIRIRHIADDFLPRGSLVFVDIGNNLFLPVDSNHPQPVKELIASWLSHSVDARNRLESLGADFYASRAIMPTQRPFHRSRLGAGFRLSSIENYRNGLS